MSATTTHIANMIQQLHAEPVQVITRPDNWQLKASLENALQALRWPEQDEDVGEIHKGALVALHSLYNRLVVAEANAALYKCQKQRAVDAFDEQSEEVERLKRECGR